MVKYGWNLMKYVIYNEILINMNENVEIYVNMMKYG